MRSDQGIWFATAEEQIAKPSEKEFVIELPMPKSEYRRMALLEMQAKRSERLGMHLLAGDMKILLEKLRETRTIRIKGKNVNDLDLEKLAKLIQQANTRASGFYLKGLFRNLRRSHVDPSESARSSRRG